jgi:hypothetical protein
VSMSSADTDRLAEEIDSAFPIVEMPPGNELPIKTLDSFEATHLVQELEQFRGKAINGTAIRLVHQEMSHLSAKAWRWLLPHYLRFCLTPEAEHNRMETEFLIYNLGPDLPFQRDTLRRLSLLTAVQVECLVHFLEWCLKSEYWKEYCPDNIAKAIGFLGANLANGRFS